MIYAMSDIHGCLEAFEKALALVDLSENNKLILLGDYIHGPNSCGVLDKIMQLQNQYGCDKVIALMGNHEVMALDGTWPIGERTWPIGERTWPVGENGEEYDDRKNREERYLLWMKNLPRYYTEGNTVFVHAGVDEEAEDIWEWETDDYTFTEKYPAQTGPFCMNIVAGHVGTAVISGNPRFHDIYYDGQSHYYIDGTVLDSGMIPVIKVDTERDKYYRVTDSGDWLILPYDEEN